MIFYIHLSSLINILPWQLTTMGEEAWVTSHIFAPSKNLFSRHHGDRPLQKRERTGKEYGCFRLFEKINYILESSPRTEVFGGGKCQNGSSTNITQNREFVWIGYR